MRHVAILSTINDVQQGQRGALMPWAAVAMGLGVALYFSMAAEPGRAVYLAAGVAIALGAGLGLRYRETLGPAGLGVALIGAGVLAAGLRTHEVAGPTLGFRYYGPVEGRIVALDRSASDKLRVTLDAVRLDNVAPERTPRRVRLSLHGEQGFVTLEPGARIMTTAHLAAPNGPAEPGGFDFQRHSYYLSLGAVGYTRTPVLLAEARPPGAARLFHLRMALSERIRAQIPGQPGAFAAAVLTGDRSGLEAAPTEDMRRANISHLLAISGLHMGLLTGFVYAALRLGLALVPPLALRFPIRKWAAFGALVAGAAYLAVSGGNVATERAFVQIGVMLVAVMLDRRAITLRSVALAALIILAHRPETLFSPGFQMSFAATAALVAVFNWVRDARWMIGRPAWQTWLFGLVVSSLVAGLATAPFAAAHFNRVAHYGLLANLLTVPVMGSLIIPAGVIAAVLAPFGLSEWAFAVMEPGLQWILGVAARIADLPGAVGYVPTPPGAVLGLLGLGGAVLVLWRGRGRAGALAPLVLAFVLWAGTDRPDVLISPTGGLVGTMGDEGRALSRARGDGFVAGVWLENDGDGASREAAAARPGWRDDGAGRSVELTGASMTLRLWHGPGVRGLEDAARACERHDIVVLSRPAREAPRPIDGRALSPLEVATRQPVKDVFALMSRAEMASAVSAFGHEGCLVIDAETLRETGSISLDLTASGLRVRTSMAVQGRRPWSP